MDKKDSKNMQIIILVLITFVLIVIGFFFSKDKEIKENEDDLSNSIENIILNDLEENNEETENKVEENVIIDGEEVISLGEKFTFTQDHKYTDNLTETFTDNIEMPYININSEDAKKVNADLKKKFENAKNSIKVESEYGFTYQDMDYEYFIWKDRVLSVLITDSEIHVPGEGRDTFSTYNFDLTTGKLLTNKELFEIIGIDDIDKTIRDSLTNAYYEGRKQMQETPEMTDHLAGAYPTVDDLLKDISYDAENGYVYVESNDFIDMEIVYYDIVFECRGSFHEVIEY